MGVGGSHGHDSSVSLVQGSNSNDHPPITHSGTSDSDRKYNLVVSGIAECDSGVGRMSRQIEDLKRVSETLSTVVESISKSCIKDTRRLGKYSPTSSRPRPLLVTMLRACDVTAVLANKSQLDNTIRIRRDLPRVVRAKQAVLMKERWKLIESGIERRDIKIQRDKLFVRGSMFGMLDASDNTKFIKSPDDESQSSGDCSEATTIPVSGSASPQFSPVSPSPDRSITDDAEASSS